MAPILLVVHEPRFARAGARCLGRVCVEQRIPLHQAQLLAAALAGFPIGPLPLPRRSRPAAPSSA